MTVLGLAAGVLTTLSFLPQVIRTFRRRSARDLSWGWLTLFGTGVLTWLGYGVILDDLPITATNSLTFALVSALAALKGWQELAPRRIRHGPRPTIG